MIEFIQAMPSAVTPRVYHEVVRMFSANLFRSLPPPFVPPRGGRACPRARLASPPGERGEMHAFLRLLLSNALVCTVECV